MEEGARVVDLARTEQAADDGADRRWFELVATLTPVAHEGSGQPRGQLVQVVEGDDLVVEAVVQLDLQVRGQRGVGILRQGELGHVPALGPPVRRGEEDQAPDARVGLGDHPQERRPAERVADDVDVLPQVLTDPPGPRVVDRISLGR